MEAPQWFRNRLNRAFDGRLRIRWSIQHAEWRLEQQIGRAVLPPIRIAENRDDLICARDGFAYVLSVRNGDRMPCPYCQWQELKVPVREFQEIRCGFCASKEGQPSRVVAGFWPLDDTLIAHLQQFDPQRMDHKQFMLDSRRDDERREYLRERTISNHIEAVTSEDYNSLVGIPQFGYSGANAYWPKGN